MMGHWLCVPQEEEEAVEEEVAQDREVVQEEELQEEDQELIETWTRNVKACTCDCESADLPPTRTPAALPPVLLTSTPPPPAPLGGQLLNCMPGEDTFQDGLVTCCILGIFVVFKDNAACGLVLICNWLHHDSVHLCSSAHSLTSNHGPNQHYICQVIFAAGLYI